MNIYLRSITKIHKNPYPPPQLQIFSKILKKILQTTATQVQTYWCEASMRARADPEGRQANEVSAFAKQNKKRSLFLCWTRVRLPPAHKRKRPNPGRLLWSWRESNPRPNRETICFLQAYLYLSFRAMTWIEPPGHDLIF